MRLFHLLTVTSLIILTFNLANDAPATYGDGGSEYPIPEKAELTHPNLGSRLDRLAVRVENGETTAQEAAREAPMHQGDSLAVTIRLSGNVDEVAAFLEENGGSPRNVGGAYIEAYVPVTLLGRLSEQPGVLRVRQILPPQPPRNVPLVGGHGPPAHLSAAWNQAGFSGQGVKVGVIEGPFWFNGLRGLMGTELPETVRARCYTSLGRFTSDLSDCAHAEYGSDHGTRVSEAVMDIAPGATLYIASPWSRGDLRNAVDWMVSEGVSVINHSRGWPFDGPGDGTSPDEESPLNTIDHAVSENITWVNAASNDAQRTWFAPPSLHSSGLVKFAGSDISNRIHVEAGDVVRVELRWDDDWPGASRDLDLIIGDPRTGRFILSSQDYQSGGPEHYPVERLQFEMLADAALDILVGRVSGEVPSWMQLSVLGVGHIEHHTINGSTLNPEESANRGMLAVGAAPWYDVTTIEPYSGRGPTTDGRVKPDVVGATCGATALSPLDANNRGFCGTSQASPHVAGMTALVRQRFPGKSPVQVAEYLKGFAVQRATPDPNHVWGHGFAQLPPPLPPQPPTIGSSITVGPDFLTVGWSPPPADDREPATSYDLRYIHSGLNQDDDANWAIMENAGTPGARQQMVTGLMGSTQYRFQVRGVNVWGPGPWSATATATTAPPVVPGVPRGLTATVAVDEARVDLLWTAPISNGGATITGYKVESSDDGTDPWVEVYATTDDGTGYTDEGADNNGPTFGVGVTRHYRVSAVNSVGTGPPSNVAVATADMCREPLGPLTAPATKTGTWVADCPSEARSGSYAQYYNFSLAEAGQVEINLTSSVDSYLLLRQGEGRDGVVVVENDNVGSRNFNSSINGVLDAGAYTVEATTYFAGQTGDFTLSVRPLQEMENLGPLTRSVDRSNSMWVSDYMSTQRMMDSYARSYTFTLAAATHVVINLTSPEDPYLYVLDTSGTVVHENDNVTTRNLNSRIDETLQAGTYTIEATTYFPARMGTFHLSIGYFGASEG